MGIFNNRIEKLLNNQGPALIRIPIDQSKTIQEQSELFFSKVYGLPKIKENVYRNLIAKEQINTGLIGPPATAKTLIAQIIRDNCNDVIYYDGASGGSGAGLISRCQANKKAKVLIVDEVDKIKKNDQNVLLGLLNDGSVDKDLKDNPIHFKMNLKIFITSNTNTKLSKPMRSRLELYYMDEYSDNEFIDVVIHCLKGQQLIGIALVIAKVLIAHEMKDVRLAMSISKKITDKDTQEDIIRVIENLLESSEDKEVDYN